MNISEEKKYIYDMMRDITSERRELTKIYYDLKSRLDDLILLDVRGLEDTPIEGIVDLHNMREVSRVTTNIEREAMGIIRKTEKEAKFKTTIPIENESDSKTETVPTPTRQGIVEQKEAIDRTNIEKSTEKPANSNPNKSRTYNQSGTTSLDKVAGIIAHILKEHGTPMKSKDLYELVNTRLDSPIKRANFSNNILPRSSKLNPKINNISHGYWQYLYN